MRRWKLVLILMCGGLVGCGTTKWSDTSRTATEQLLISDAIDQAVNRIDFRNLADKPVYLETKYLQNVTDQGYLVSSLRQHMLASGCVLKEKAEDASLIVEARAGAVGTNRADLLFGVPAFNVPAAVPVAGVPSSIPEIALVKKTQQQAVAKIAVFAISKSGEIVWQSGTVPVDSKASDIWVLGAGPFQRGPIYDGTKFAGGKLPIPLLSDKQAAEGRPPLVPVQSEAIFINPQDLKSPERASPPQTATAPTPQTAAAAPPAGQPQAAATSTPAAAAAPPAAVAATKPAESNPTPNPPATASPPAAVAATKPAQPDSASTPPAAAAAAPAPPAATPTTKASAPAPSGAAVASAETPAAKPLPPTAPAAPTATQAAAPSSPAAKPSPPGQAPVPVTESPPAIAKLPPSDPPVQPAPDNPEATAASSPSEADSLLGSWRPLFDAALRGDRGQESIWDPYGDPPMRLGQRAEEGTARR
ncbi:MAG: DUF6655 family protein [Pirellulales bacterium]